MDILVLGLRSILNYASLQPFDNPGLQRKYEDVGQAVDGLASFRPNFGMDLPRQHQVEGEEYTTYSQSDAFITMKKNIQKDTRKNWFQSHGADYAEDDQHANELPTVLDYHKILFKNSWEEDFLPATSPYLNDPFTLLRGLAKEFFKLYKLPGNENAENQDLREQQLKAHVYTTSVSYDAMLYDYK